MLATDTVSATYGNADGFSYCGPRAYTIAPLTYSSVLDLAVDTLTLGSDDPTQAIPSQTITI